MTTLILSVFFSIVASAYDVEVDGIYYNLVPNGNVAEVTNGANKYEGDITIPSSIKVNDTEYSVTSVGNSAFEDCISLTSITIPNSVTSIGGSAFAKCGNLENVYCYAEKIPYLGYYIFKDSYIEYATLHVPSSAPSYYQVRPLHLRATSMGKRTYIK